MLRLGEGVLETDSSMTLKGIRCSWFQEVVDAAKLKAWPLGLQRMISIINISLLRDGILKEKLVCYKEMEAPWHLSVQSERRRCGQILPPEHILILLCYMLNMTVSWNYYWGISVGAGAHKWRTMPQNFSVYNLSNSLSNCFKYLWSSIAAGLGIWK